MCHLSHSHEHLTYQSRERQMNNNNALQLNSSLSWAALIICIFFLSPSHSLSISSREWKEFISTMPILSHHCERLLIENCPKKIIHNFCVPPLHRHTGNLFLMPDSTQLFWTLEKKIFLSFCSTINNTRIYIYIHGWMEMLFHEEREKRQARMLCTVCTYNLSSFVCI